MRKRYFLLLAVVLLAACGRQQPYDFYLEYEPATPVLSILAPELGAPQIMENMNAARRANNLPEVDFRFSNFNMFPLASMQSPVEMLQAKLAAGDSYDFVLFDHQSVWELVNAGHLVDFYTLIDINDVWLQPLRALEINGGLYSFPLGFGFHYVSINTSLPPHIIDYFVSSNTMSIHDMLRIYYELVNYHGFYDMNFASGFMGGYYPGSALAVYVGNFIDFNNRTTDLTNPEFLSFLTYLYGSFNHPTVLYPFRPSNPPQQRNYSQTARISNHVFRIDTDRINSVLAFLDSYYYIPSALVFYYGRPMTDKQGRLLLDNWYRVVGNTTADMTNAWPAVSIPVTENRYLAWEFTQHLYKYVFANNNLLHVGAHFASPIFKDMFRSHGTWLLSAWHEFWRDSPLPLMDTLLHTGISNRAINEMLNQIEALNHMPMAPAKSHVPDALLEEYLGAFMSGQITAEEFARRLEAGIGIWLAE